MKRAGHSNLGFLKNSRVSCWLCEEENVYKAPNK
uniref:Uncharacterized protein n=1 Tax=Rhizophora mucronata TaxID=61149 RepID=A0A2P2R1A3_RHIMU